MRGRLLKALRDDSGQTLVIVGVSIIMLLGLAAFAIDMGAILNAHRQLQASTDAAATAAAQELDIQSRTTVTAKAQEYSAMAGQKNAYASLGGVSIATTFSCLTTVGLPTPCTNPATANAVKVTSSATVPLFFARVLGFSTTAISATATATMRTGAMPPLDVALVLDATQSMNNGVSCPGLSGSPTKLDCALYGIRTLLGSLWPCANGVSNCPLGNAVDTVALFIFPGVANATEAGYGYDCAASPDWAPVVYSATTLYQVLPFGNDYRTSNTASLNTASNLVKAARGGASGCQQGIEGIGGKGTYFAGAMQAAQAALVARNRADSQRVMIVLSDGDAGTDAPSKITTALEPNQCQQAISVAQAATATSPSTTVYSVAYGASTSSGCGKDTPSISPCSTMRQLASDSTKFYSSNTGSSGCSSTVNGVLNMGQIFQRIAIDLTATRIVDDSTQ